MTNKLFQHTKQIIILNGICFLISLVFCFFGMYSIPLGFLLGSVVAIFVKCIYFLLGDIEEKNKFNPLMIPVNILFNCIVIVLIIGSIFLSLVLEHRHIMIFSSLGVSVALIIAFSSNIYRKIVNGN